MKSILLISLFDILVMTFSIDYEDKIDRFLIACHSTDMACFKRQYAALRDHALLGNEHLGIDTYEPFIFSSGDSETCVKLSGVEYSKLVAIAVSSMHKELKMVIELPVKIQQIPNTSALCAKPDKHFSKHKAHDGVLKKFAGNATVTVSYPYTLRKKKGKVYMALKDEYMDVVLDMPDLSQHDKNDRLEAKLYEWSEWAYEMVQHVDVAQHCLAPYTGQLKIVMDRFPIEKFLLLYPDEDYNELQFTFNIEFNEEE